MHRLTIQSLLGPHVGERTALLAPSRPPLTYAQLVALVDETAAALNGIGIARNDRVAVVLPNGPEMATSFLAVSMVAACAPLNPGYRESEFEFYFSDLRPKVLLVEAGADSPAAKVARSQGIPVIEVVPARDKSAGMFSLSGITRLAARPIYSGPQDVALVLHTSGTTSRPKMIPLTQANLCHSAAHIRESLALTPDDRCLNVMPLFHIHGLIAAVLSSLAAGGSVVCAPGFLAPSFFEWLDEFAPTWYTAVPTIHQAILARASRNRDSIARSRLRFVRSSSAPLPPKVMEELEQTFGAPAIEAYGMTEAAHQMASNPLPPRVRKPGSVGLAAGPEIAIMDGSGTLLECGETGEIVIRGPNVTAGYLDNAAADAIAFANGWFRTGDLGHLDRNGYLFISGRTKEIINRAGEKISPREVDDVLMDHPAVAQALTFALPDAKLGEDVGAAVVIRDGSNVTERELREFAARRLADFKVPRLIVFLPEIPKGATGKLQRIGLAERLGLNRPPEQPELKEYVAPRTPEEHLLAGLWRQVLKIDRVGVHDNFLDLGGDSMLASLLLVRLEDAAGVKLSMSRLFDSLTLERMAEAVAECRGRQTEQRPPAIGRVPREPEMPLSFAQERLWFLAQFEPESSVYNVSRAVRCRGPLDADALAKALNAIVARHEILRTSLRETAHGPVQIANPAVHLELRIVQVTETNLQEQLLSAARAPFDLTHDLPLRATLFGLAPDDHCLLFVIHHIASDGWSLAVLFREISVLYEAFRGNKTPLLPDLPIQYSDFAQWHRQWLASGVMDEQIAWWKRRLAGMAPILPLPTDFPRPARHSFHGASEKVRIPELLTTRLRSFSRRERTTLYTTLLAGFHALLARYTRQTAIYVGSPIANRTRAELEGLIGFFVNTLVLPADLSADPSFRGLVKQVKETALEVYSHQDLPFEKLVEAMAPERDLSHMPLIQAVFVLQNMEEAALRLSNIEVQPVYVPAETAKFDLTLAFEEHRAGALEGILNFSTDLFTAATIRRMFGHYTTLLEEALNAPDRPVSTLPLLTEAERRQLVVDWNDTRREYPQLCVHELFHEQAVRRPDAIALVCGNVRMSYGELERRSNHVALGLRRLGVGPDVRVGILMDRSPEMLIGLLGTLKAGGAYLPLDARYPLERLRFILNDAGAATVLTKARFRERVSEAGSQPVLIEQLEQGATTPERDVPPGTPDSLAYVMYTSGSTGMPKGVEVTHRGIVRLLFGVDYARFGEDEVFLQLSSPTFDVSTLELWGPLLHGGRCVLYDGEMPAVEELGRVLRDERVTTLWLTSSLFNAVVEEAASALAPVRQLLVGGEPVSAEHIRRAQAALPDTEFINGYGPTEATTFTCCYRIPRPVAAEATSIPIGRPIGNTRVYVLDHNREPVPVGVPGELYIGGDGLARGYVNRPELTAQLFLPDPFDGRPAARMYKSGDLVQYRPDGNIEFLGRLDEQVKVRGFRIEPGEIETALAAHPSIKAACVIVRQDKPGSGQLIAYAVPVQDAILESGELRRHLGRRLPEYMLPSQFVFLAALPLTPSGKIDRRALPLPDQQPSSGSRPALRDPLELRVLSIWRQLLGTTAVGFNDDFFESGGHSLLALQLTSRIERAFGRKLTLPALFEAPTVEQQAALLRAADGDPAPRRRIAMLHDGSGSPFFCLNAGPLFLELSCSLGDRPFYSVWLGDLEHLSVPSRIEDIAAEAVRTIRELQPEGPYWLGGWCVSGLIAFEAAQQLLAAGQKVSQLVLFETVNSASCRPGSRAARLKLRLHVERERLRYHVSRLTRMRPADSVVYAWKRLQGVFEHITDDGRRLKLGAALSDSDRAAELAARNYTPAFYSGPAVLIRCTDRPAAPEWDMAASWKGLLNGDARLYDIPGDHRTMFHQPNVALMANRLRESLPS